MIFDTYGYAYFICTKRAVLFNMGCDNLGGIEDERFAFFDHETTVLDMRDMTDRPFINYWYADSQGMLYDALLGFCQLNFDHIVLFTNTYIPHDDIVRFKANGIEIVSPLESTHIHAMVESYDYDMSKPLQSILYIYDGTLNPMSSYYYGVMRHYNVSQLFVEYPRY